MLTAPDASTKSWASIEPIFIVGVGRSGTTLLVNLMGAHPLLAPIYETPFLRKVIRHCETTAWAWSSPILHPAPSLIRFLLKAKSDALLRKLVREARNLPEPSWLKKDYEQFPYGLSHCIFYSPEDLHRETERWIRTLCHGPISEEAIYRSARQYVDRLFSIHCARLNKAFWVNKTPALLNYADRLAKLYPSARYIHILRDGRDAAASLLSLPWGPKTVAEAARHWRTHVTNGRLKLMASNRPFMELRYNDLVESPDSTLESIFAFLGIEADPTQMLETVPVYRTKRETWKSSFSTEDRVTFHREAGRLLIELGFEDDENWVR